MRLRILDLANMHPRLLWGDIIAAAIAVLSERTAVTPYPLRLQFHDVPGAGTGEVILEIDPAGVSDEYVQKTQRTFEPQRMVELAAIAVAGLSLFYAGGHQIQDVALRGGAADYLVGDEHRALEIAGRSRRSDFRAAWDTRWQRLTDRLGSGFYVCVVEFESPAARLAFAT